MASVDWRGLSMAMAQLKELSEPGKIDLMEREYELRSIESEKNRAFEGAKHQFDYWQDEHTSNKKLIRETEKNMMEMSAEGASLKPEYQSIDMPNVIKENDETTRRGLEGLNADLEAKVGTQATYLQEITDLYNNMMYGKQLRDSQGGADFKYFTERNYTKDDKLTKDAWQAMNPQEKQKYLDHRQQEGKKGDDNFTGAVWYSTPESRAAGGITEDERAELRDIAFGGLTPDIVDHYFDKGMQSFDVSYYADQQVSWDFNDDMTVSPEEYDKALDNILKMMTDSNQSIKGIKEGFYSGFNPIETEQENLRFKEEKMDVDTTRIKLDELKEDPDGNKDLIRKLEKSIWAADEKKKHKQVKAFFEYQELEKKVNHYTNDSGDYQKRDGKLEKNEWLAHRKKQREFINLMTPEQLNTFKSHDDLAGEGSEGTLYSMLNNADIIDDGFDREFQQLLLEQVFDQDPGTNMLHIIKTKNAFNWMISRWKDYPGNMTETEKDTFKKHYDKFKEHFPEHFKNKDNDLKDW